MKHRLRLLPLLLILLALLLSGCNAIANLPVVGQYPLTLKDSYDREVTIPRLPERIISLAPSNTEILFALGLGSKVVGVTDACDYPAEAEQVEKVSGYQGVDLEKVIAAKPGLVLADSITGQDVVNQLENAGIPVLAIRSDDIADVLQNIRLIGQATNAVRQSEELTDGLQARLDAVKAKLVGLPDEDKVTVFYEVWNDPLYTSGLNTFVANVIATAGGTISPDNTTGDWPIIQLEALIAANPEVIILGHAAETPEDVMAKTDWRTIAAVQQGRVYAVNPDIFSRPTPRVLDALEQLAALLHPDLFNK